MSDVKPKICFNVMANMLEAYKTSSRAPAQLELLCPLGRSSSLLDVSFYLIVDLGQGSKWV